ncbi:MAG TPA: hypothetical protein VGO00_22560 [Kofleriaceae bacterium]|nr:hypothetical protein [Kofleriaceae bacterium]
MTPAEIAAEMQAIRAVGWVYCDWRPRGMMSIRDLDDYLIEAGMSPSLRDGWQEINKGEAMRLTQDWASQDLAYRTKTGAPACDVFFRQLTRRARYFTNRTGASWTPKTNHTFDAGVVGLDGATIAMLWFADED